jgi:hypothetical protein
MASCALLVGGQERGEAVKGRGGRKRQGGEVGGKGQMRMLRWRGLLGVSERVSKSDPFSSNNRLSISRTFPGTTPNITILPFPDVLAQTPRFNYPLIRLRSATLAPSQTGIPFNKHPQAANVEKKQNNDKTNFIITIYHP